MAKTVQDLRNEIRVGVGRFERETSSGFTKETLAAVAGAVGHPVDDAGRLPPKGEMRASILAAVEDGDAERVDRSFRKAELAAIAAHLADAADGREG
jgi:hypothetical protein